MIERVRKLQDRARRDDGPEARSARNLARVLIREHGLTAAELRPTRLEETASRMARAASPAPPPVRVRFDPGRRVVVTVGGLRVRWKIPR